MLKSQNFLGRLDEAFSNRDAQSSGVKTPPLPASLATPAKPAVTSPPTTTGAPQSQAELNTTAATKL